MSIKLKYFFINDHTTTAATTTTTATTTTATTTATMSRTALFQKSTRKNQEFERFLCAGQEAAILDATTSKYIPLTYFVTPHAAASTAARRTSTRQSHGLADKMPYESFRLINLQQKGNHAHSLVLFKSRAITTNPEQIAIFECNGQVSQSEIRVIHTQTQEDEPTGTVYDVTEHYFKPISPRVCMNYGNNKYNPGYCGMFGIIAMVVHRAVRRETTTCDISYQNAVSWIADWTTLLTYMRQNIPNEPESHGCMGTELAAQVQEIIAAHPSTATGHQKAEKEINNLIRGVRPPTPPYC